MQRPALMPLLALLLAFLAAPSRADDKPTNFEDQIKAIFERRCTVCHDAEVNSGGLDLTDYSAAMTGGSSGKVISPGDAGSSKLYRQMARQERPFMPPDSPPLPAAELALVKAWIDQGARRDAKSASAAPPPKPKVERIVLAPPSASGPAPDFPEMSKVLHRTLRRPAPVTALAASPRADFIAAASYEQVLIYENPSLRLRAVLPFPEGSIVSLEFSASGELLLAAGGRPAASGAAVLWDVRSGARIASFINERDSWTSADISSDHALIALGSSKKTFKVLSVATGATLWEQKKHTNWVTALKFSHDGVLLASGDRDGGLMIWEAETGREFQDLRGHSALISALAWRQDSDVLASASEDGSLRLWRAEDGAAIRRIDAHGGGVLDLDFSKLGELASVGRDARIRRWSQSGQRLFDIAGAQSLTLQVAWSADGKKLVSGEESGPIRVLERSKGQILKKGIAGGLELSKALAESTKNLASARAQEKKAKDALARSKAELEKQRGAQSQSREALKSADDLMKQLDADLQKFIRAQAEQDQLVLALALQADRFRAKSEAKPGSNPGLRAARRGLIGIYRKLAAHYQKRCHIALAEQSQLRERSAAIQSQWAQQANLRKSQEDRAKAAEAAITPLSAAAPKLDEALKKARQRTRQLARENLALSRDAELLTLSRRREELRLSQPIELAKATQAQEAALQAKKEREAALESQKAAELEKTAIERRLNSARAEQAEARPIAAKLGEVLQQTRLSIAAHAEILTSAKKLAAHALEAAGGEATPGALEAARGAWDLARQTGEELESEKTRLARLEALARSSQEALDTALKREKESQKSLEATLARLSELNKTTNSAEQKQRDCEAQAAAAAKLLADLLVEQAAIKKTWDELQAAIKAAR